MLCMRVSRHSQRFLNRLPASALILGCGLGLASTARAAMEVIEAAHALPVAQEVDVVVVGGSSGGVAAAVEAAQRGAKVFLVAPRPYLGEDLCASYRLWLEPGEKPLTQLAREVFKATPPAPSIGPGLTFTYYADQPSSPPHRDKLPPALLADGRWGSAASESVQYNSNVTLQLNFKKEQDIRTVTVLIYQRQNDFEVEMVTASVSADAKTWKPLTTLTNDKLGQLDFEASALPLSATVRTKTRYLRLHVRKPPEAKRILLGEVVIGGDQPEPPLAETGRPKAVTPMQVKRALDQALLQAGVPFLYGSFPTDILRDAEGRPAGIVMTHRSGRQAVIAKVIIDATERATVARLAKAEFKSYPPETQVFSRAVVGGPARAGDTVSLRRPSEPILITDRKGDIFPVREYQIQVPMRDGSFAAFADAEQLARDLTWSKEAVDASEVLFQVPPDSFRSTKPHAGRWNGAEGIALEAFQPTGVERLFVLGGCADVSRKTAADLVRPVNLMALGPRIGAAAAEMARRSAVPAGVRLAGVRGGETVPGVVRTAFAETDPRPARARTIPAEAHPLPVLGEYDVVVVGGGTGGAPAGIAAARQGAKTLLLEYLHGLGGVGTLGYISTYYHGNRVGFTQEIDAGLREFGETNSRISSASWEPEHKSEWYRRELRKAGADLWYGVLGVGAVVENHRVLGVVVTTPHGRGVVRAKMVVDATGNADIAAAAGAPCRYTDATEVAVQGTGLPPRELGQKYTNTDYTFVDDTDVFDLWRVLVVARQKFRAAYDLGQLIDTRERRQIVGDFTLSPMDMMLGRTFPDTVVIARSNFDTHGYIVHPLFMLRPPDRADVDVRVPYRCLLPRGLDRILVTGLGVSAHRDALPVIRMQADVQNQGYAAGIAAAMIVQTNCATRALDIKALQRHLVGKGILPAGILTETDSFPLSREQIAEAVRAVTNGWQQLERVLVEPEVAKPLLRQAFEAAPSEEARLTYAHILGMLGDATGTETLARAVSRAAWDQGWRYTGMGQFGPSMSPLDSWIIALGRTGDPRALLPILEKVSRLDTNSEFSHFRAVALALEALADPSAARPLAELLQRPGLAGHAVTTIQAALENNPASSTDNRLRNQALSELVLARALYRCGDHQGLGEKTLRQFAQDLHGHYARHAQAVLQRK